MKKVFLKILEFSAFLLASCFVLILVVASSTAFTPYLEKLFFSNPGEEGNTFERVKELDKWLNAKNLEHRGLVLGGSSVYINVNPNILTEKTGIDFYCAGNGAQTISNSLHILNYCLASTEKIDYLILGVDQVLWKSDGTYGVTDWVIHNYNPARKYIFAMVAVHNNLLLWAYYFYFTVKRLLPYTKEHLKPYTTNAKHAGKAYLCSDISGGVNQVEKQPSPEMTKGNNESLLEIIRICKNKNIRLVLYIPKIINLNEDMLQLKGMDTDIINGYNTPVTTLYFYDYYHMSCDGATINTLWVADEFNKMINTRK